MKKVEYEVDLRQPIKDFIKLNISKKFYRYIKRNGYYITLNDEVIEAYKMCEVGDKLTIFYNEEAICDDHLYEFDIDVLYECEEYMVIYKPKGLKTIPTGYNDFKSLYNAILYYYKKNNINKTIHFINRLDKDTEGILVVAKDKMSANYLSKHLDEVNRYYLAYVCGILDNKEGSINKPIKKGEGIKRIISEDGKEAITHYRVLKEVNDNSILELKLDTGRCHQIRVHLSSIDHPILGDPLYGDGDDLHLCSYKIEFSDMNNKNISIIKYPSWYKIEKDA